MPRVQDNKEQFETKHMDMSKHYSIFFKQSKKLQKY